MSSDHGDDHDDDRALLHLVFGGDVKDSQGLDFKDPGNLDIVGIYPSNAEALAAWRAASQSHVDSAERKYVLVHLHRLLDDPEHEENS